MDVTPIDVDAWLDELVAEAQDVAVSNHRNIAIVAKAHVDSIDGDHRYLSRAASNLLRNAVQYAHSRVEFSVAKEGNQYVLLVDDDGTGIPAEAREMVFEPFSRLDHSRDRASGGFGIGLAIVRQIARWHDGSIAVEEAAIGGTRMRFAWNTQSTSVPTK